MKGIFTGILLSIPIWVVIVLILMAFTGCSYTGRNDPNIQRYFSNDLY